LLGSHSVPQLPQLSGFEVVSMHTPLQLATVQVLVQAPVAQALPSAQTLPAVPQLFESVVRFTHAVVGPRFP
jgi:hypothetical protein